MTKAKPLPDQETLKRLLDYDPENGVLTWKARTPDMFEGKDAEFSCRVWNARYAVQTAGHKDQTGYVTLSLLGDRYKAHRVIFMMVFGSEPEFIDHFDGVRSNNALNNLRSVSRMVNNKNASRRSDNKSGTTGIRFDRKRKVWAAAIGDRGRLIQLGHFATKDEAIAARRGAMRVIGYNLNHGRGPTSSD